MTTYLTFAFRAEFEERYRGAWDRGEAGPAPSLVLHLRGADQNALPWDIVHNGRVARLSLAELFPRLGYSTVKQVEPEHFAALFDAHEAELQSARGENESKDFIVEHVYQLTPRSIRTPVDFWRELLRMHFANRSLPPLFAKHAAGILQGKGLFTDQPVAAWLSSKSMLLRVVQDAWYRYLSGLGLDGSRTGEPPHPDYVARVDIPFDHSDVQVLVDSMFLDGMLHPLADVMPDVNKKLQDWTAAADAIDTGGSLVSLYHQLALFTAPNKAVAAHEAANAIWRGRGFQLNADAYMHRHPLRRGDFIVFSFDGEAQARYPGLRGQPFFKIVRGVPGDAVTVAGRHVAINGEEVGVAKLQAYDHSPLDPITPTVIPPGHYYVQGTSPDSFDSRYQDSGLVRAEQVVGVVVPLY